MRTKNRLTILAVAAVAALLATGCGDDAETTSSDPTAQADNADSTDNSASDGSSDTSSNDADPDANTGSSSGGSGTLVLDGESIELDTVLCHLESQPSAGGGGNILFVVQGQGVDADAEPVMIDISRFDDESMFAGDSIEVYVGEVTAEEGTSLTASLPTGTVTLAGSKATADGLTLENLDTGTDHNASFDISC